MKNITQSLKVIALALLVSFGLSYVYAWTAPTQSAPAGNVSAPINTSATSQYKAGALGIEGLIHGYSSAIIDGYVGIGTTPVQPLDISKNSTGDATRLRITNTGTSGRSWDIGVLSNLPAMAAGSLGFADTTAGQWRMIIDPSGNVGIGTATPVSLLQVGVGVPTSSRFGFPNNGLVTIADNPAGYSLLAGNIESTGYFNSDQYWLAGSCWAAYGGCPSDARLKDHIRPFHAGLEALLNINPIYFRYNGLGGTPKSDHDLLGVLAQDVEKGAPELIKTESVSLHPDDINKTDIKKLDSSGLQYLLINAVKELYAKWFADSQDLHAKIDSQQKQIDELKSIVCQEHASAEVCR